MTVDELMWLLSMKTTMGRSPLKVKEFPGASRIPRLTIERLCDASADDEFKAFGVSDKRVFELVTVAMAQYLGSA